MLNKIQDKSFKGLKEVVTPSEIEYHATLATVEERLIHVEELMGLIDLVEE